MHQSFRYGFEKKAWDLPTARKAFKQSVGNKLIRRNLSVSVKNDIPSVGLATNNQIGGRTAALSKPAKHQMTPEVVSTMEKNPILIKGQGKILAQGQMAPAFRRAGVDTSKLKTPQEMEMFNRTALQHEHAENKWGPKTKSGDAFNWGFTGGHKHPGVILEESNMVATMPPEMKNVKDTFTNARNVGGEKGTLEHYLPGFEYGKTRLSRHAKKNLLRNFNEKVIADMKKGN